jgi:ABC-type sugar transport system permease subunit
MAVAQGRRAPSPRRTAWPDGTTSKGRIDKGFMPRRPSDWLSRNKHDRHAAAVPAARRAVLPRLRHHADLPVFNISLYEWDGLGEAEYIGMRNYEELMGRRPRLRDLALEQPVKWLVLYLLAIPAGLFIALFLNQTVVGIRLYKSLFFFPFVLSQVVVGLVFSWFYLPREGLLNGVLGWFGFGPINVLGDPTLATYGIIAAGLWPQTAYCMILYLTGLNAVDPEQIEAGRLDGAKGWKMLWYIILPQLEARHLHRLRGDDHRRAAVLRPDLDHDQWRAVRLHPGAVVLHVRKGAVGIRLPHGLWRGHRGGAVPHHAGLHRLFPVVDVARRARRGVRGADVSPAHRTALARGTDRLQGFAARGADPVAAAADRGGAVFDPAAAGFHQRQLLGGPSSFEFFTNYGKVFFESTCRAIMLNSVLITVPTVIGAVALSCMTGFALGIYRFRGNLLIFFMFIAGNFVPFQILMVPVRDLTVDRASTIPRRAGAVPHRVPDRVLHAVHAQLHPRAAL